MDLDTIDDDGELLALAAWILPSEEEGSSDDDVSALLSELFADPEAVEPADQPSLAAEVATLETAPDLLATAVETHEDRRALAVVLGEQRRRALEDRATTAQDPNSTRRRQKEELLYLRQRVSELEDQLKGLRDATSDNEANAANTNTPPSNVDGVSGWRAIAERQKTARRDVEIENFKLRQMMESQVRLARNLERLLWKRPNVARIDLGLNTKRRRRHSGDKPHEVNVDDVAMFQQLLACIERTHSQTQAVFEDNALNGARSGHRSIRIRTGTIDSDLRDQIRVELTDITTMPFPLDAVASAAWRCITSGYMSVDHEVYNGLAGVEDVLAIKYAITLSRRRLQVEMLARAAMKRFVVSDDEIVDVWEAMSDTMHHSSTVQPGIQVRERGWTVMRRRGDTATEILTCMQMIPLVSYDASTPAGEDRQVGLVTNLALDYYANQLELAQQGIESLLLDEMRMAPIGLEALA